MAKKLPTPYDLLIQAFHTQAGIAEAAGLKSYQAVQQWGETIPAPHVLPLCRAAMFSITPHQLRPDLYPNPTDALPMSMVAGLSNPTQNREERAESLALAAAYGAAD